MSSLLEINQLRKSYGRTLAVEDLSLHVKTGEIFGLLGPNGAGKTTTMLMLVGLLAPDAGSVRISGQTLSLSDRSMRRLLGFVPQELALYPSLSAQQNLAFFGRLYGLRGEHLGCRIEAVLEATGLTASAGNTVGTFSGGMKRRLNFAIALLHEPRLLVLDEPTVGVDPQSRSHLLECIGDLSKSGVAVVYASHYMEEVEAICDRVGIVDRGRMIACGTLPALLSGVQEEARVLVDDPPEDLHLQMQGLAEVQAEADGAASVIVRAQCNGKPATFQESLTEVMAALAKSRVVLRRIESSEASLERLFLELTGRRLRD